MRCILLDMKALITTLLVFVIQQVIAQSIPADPFATYERWYPVFQNIGASGPAFIDKTGQVKLAFDTSFTLLGDGDLESNIWDGAYMVLEKRTTETWSNEKYYLTDRHGNLKSITDVRPVAMNYDRIIVQEPNRKMALWKSDLTPLTPFKYDYIRPYSEGLASAETDNHFTLLNRQGMEVIPPTHWFTSVDSLQHSSTAYQNNASEGLSNYSENGRLGIMDTAGRNLTPALFDYLYAFHNGLACASINKMEGYVDKTGKFIIGPAAEGKYYGDFSNGLVAAKNEDKTYSYINTRGQIALPGKYVYAGAFNHGYAVVSNNPGERNNKKQIIDIHGKVVYEGYFVDAWFRDDVVVFTTERRFTAYDIYSNNYYYTDYHFHTLWQPLCSQKVITNLTTAKGCDLSMIKWAYMGSSLDKKFTIAELIPFLNSINPVKLRLELQGNAIQLPASVTRMSNLEELDVSYCNLIALPAAIGNLAKLKKLKFDYTNIKHLPESLYQLKHLESISVKHTQLSLSDIVTFQQHMPDVKITFK